MWRRKDSAWVLRYLVGPLSPEDNGDMNFVWLVLIGIKEAILDISLYTYFHDVFDPVTWNVWKSPLRNENKISRIALETFKDFPFILSVIYIKDYLELMFVILL